MGDGTESLGIAIAFTAGVLSFLSPCVLPLVPSYITYLTGLALDDASRSRRTAILHAALFVAGFTLVFLALGATATALGRALHAGRLWVTRSGAVIVILLAFYLLGAFDSVLMARERRVQLATKPVGYLGSVLVGVAFGAGWTPCIGPVLAGILVYAASEASLQRGLLLLGAYSAGLALPFLVASAAVPRFLVFFARIRRGMHVLSRLSGALLLVVGLLLLTDNFTRLAGYLEAFTPDALRRRL